MIPKDPDEKGKFGDFMKSLPWLWFLRDYLTLTGKGHVQDIDDNR